MGRDKTQSFDVLVNSIHALLVPCLSHYHPLSSSYIAIPITVEKLASFLNLFVFWCYFARFK